MPLRAHLCLPRCGDRGVRGATARAGSVAPERSGRRSRSKPRAAAANAIVRENQRPGTTDWLVTRIEDAAANQRDDRYRRQRAIEGYVSRTSVRAGER